MSGPGGPRTGQSAIGLTIAELWETTFVDKDALKSAKALVKVLSAEGKEQFAQAKFRKLLEFAVVALETNELPDDTKSALLSDKEVATVFTGLYDILASAVRHKVKDTVVLADLGKVQFPAAYKDDLVKAYRAKREALEAAAEKRRITLPSLTGVNWRVDITISTTSMARVFKPSVTLQLTLSDGRIRTFECSLKQFHELRYNVAKVLKDMLDLAEHPTLVRNLDS